MPNRPVPAFCERTIGHARGLWAPKPFERVRIVSSDMLGTFIGTVDRLRLWNGDDLGGMISPAVNGALAVVLVDEPLVAAAPDWMRVCAWTELSPAPPAGCQCPVCSACRPRVCG